MANKDVYNARVNGNGDGVGAGMCFVGMDGDGSQMYGDGVGIKKFHGDGTGMGLIFTTVSVFSVRYGDLVYTICLLHPCTASKTAELVTKIFFHAVQLNHSSFLITSIYARLNLIAVRRQSTELGAESKFALLGVRPLTTNADEDDKRQCHGNNRCSHAATDDHGIVQCIPIITRGATYWRHSRPNLQRFLEVFLIEIPKFIPKFFLSSS